MITLVRGQMQIENLQPKRNNIEAILNSLDGVKRAEAPLFLYGRINARLNSSKQSIFEKFSNLISRPVIGFPFLFLVLLMNGIVFQSNLKSAPAKSENTSEALFTGDNFEEILFYDPSDSEYAPL